jgi:hypothetical protein
MSKRHTNTMHDALSRMLAAIERMLEDESDGMLIPHDNPLRDRINDVAAQIEGYNEQAEADEQPPYAPIVLGRRGVHVF